MPTSPRPRKSLTRRSPAAPAARRGVPACTMRPWSSSTMRVARRSASSMSCVTSTMVLPERLWMRASLLLQRLARHRVERAEGLVHQQHARVAPPAPAPRPRAAAGRPRAGAGSARGSSAGVEPQQRQQFVHARADARCAASPAAPARWQCCAPPSSAGTARSTGSRNPCAGAASSGGKLRISLAVQTGCGRCRARAAG